MRIIFAGTPAIAVPSLRALAGSSHEVGAVITRRDAPQGRKRVLTPSPVAAAAEELDVPVIKTNRLDGTAEADISAFPADLGVIVAYGGLVKEPVLSLPARGWINLHFSLLPRWRGAAPVQHAVWAGDEVTGASVFQLVPELDAGPVFDTMTYSIPAEATSGDVLDELSVRGADLLAAVVDRLDAGDIVAREQAGATTYASKLVLEDARVSWDAPAPLVHAQIRAMTPEPGSFTFIDEARLKILRTRISSHPELPPGEARMIGKTVLVGTASDPIELLQVQPAGKKPMSAADWWRGTGSTVAYAR